MALGIAATGRLPWKSVPVYNGAQPVGAVLGALGTWLAFGGPGRAEAKLAATYPAQGAAIFRLTCSRYSSPSSSPSR